MVRSLLSVDGGPIFLARSPLPIYMLVVSGDVFFIYHDAGLRLMLGHLLQNPKNQGPTVFGCGSAATFVLRIPGIEDQFMTELVWCVSPKFELNDHYPSA
jgi:hypothetical protein